jgi:hypothetical protein
MINFDMIGRDEKPSPQTEGLIDIPTDTTNRLNLIGALYSPDYKRVVVEANNSVGLTLDDRFDRDAALNVLFRSDQFPFLLHNVPAFWWFTGFHPDYHHITDTAEKIDYPKMAKILQLAYLAAWRFATDDGVPKFVANPEPPPPAAAASADAPASEAPAEPVHHRPITPVTIVPTTGAAGEAVAPAPAVVAPAPVAPATEKAAAKSAKGKKGSKSAAAPAAVPDNAQPAPLAPPVAVPTPAASAATTPGPTNAPATAATPAAATPAPAPRHHRPITPVVIQATTGEDSVVKQNPTDPEVPAATAPAATPAPGSSVVQKPTLATQPAKSKGAPPPVTPVKLGGKLPGQDEYEDDTPTTPAPPK